MLRPSCLVVDMVGVGGGLNWKEGECEHPNQRPSYLLTAGMVMVMVMVMVMAMVVVVVVALIVAGDGDCDPPPYPLDQTSQRTIIGKLRYSVLIMYSYYFVFSIFQYF